MYNRLSDYYKNKYSVPIKKICIDGGFTCPNRDGTRGKGGCIFCGDEGSGEQIADRGTSVKKQITSELARLGEGKYIAYYQSFTSTYASVEVLKERFMPAIESNQIVGLAIGTRPDCINADMAKFLGELSKQKDITIELGLQTSSDSTATLINRCYLTSEFTAAIRLLNEYNIDIVVHIILGLPKETITDLENTVTFLNKHKYSGIKIHSLYVSRGTVLAEMLSKNEYTPLDFDTYVSQVVYVLTHISPEIIVHRITGDGDKKMLIAPLWSTNKIKVINAINKQMHDKNQKQGCYMPSFLSLN